MYPAQSVIYRRITIWLMGIVIVVGVCVAIYKLFVEPKITVSAPTGSTVIVTLLSNGSTVATKKVTGNQLTIAVGSDMYSVRVSSAKQGKQVFYVTTRMLQNQHVTLSARPEFAATTVARQVAYDAVPAPGTIDYLDTTKRIIGQLAPDGTRTALDTTKPVSTLSSDNTGAAAGIHIIKGNAAIIFTNNQLFVLSNGRLAPLNTTGFPDQLTRIVIGTNPSQSSFTIGANETIFWYSTPDAAPKRLLTLDKKFDQLAYGGTKILAYSTRMPNALENIKYAYSGYAVDPILIDTTTTAQTTFTSGPVANATLSPEGTLATIELQNGMYTKLYDVANKVVRADIESPDTTTPAWIDNTHFLYGKLGSVWQYDTTTGNAFSIGTLPSDTQPTSITFDTTTDSYLVTGYDSEDTAAIYRLAASSDPNGERAAALDTAQQSNSQFSFTYTNISHPTLVITTSVLDPNPTLATFTALTLQSRQAALDTMKSHGVNPTGLTILYDPATF